MIKQHLFLLILILFLTQIAGAQNPHDIVADRFEEVPGRGLAINTNPAGARVFINGVERGVTPVVFDSFLPGEYSVRLTRDGYIDREFPVTLFGASRLLVSIKMERPQGQAVISISKAEEAPEDLPFNPHVTVNSMFFRDALELNNNSVIINLPYGRHTIRARARGFEDVTITIFINDDIMPVNIIMKPK